MEDKKLIEAKIIYEAQAIIITTNKKTISNIKEIIISENYKYDIDNILTAKTKSLGYGQSIIMKIGKKKKYI
jgi:hypothetical protein